MIKRILLSMHSYRDPYKFPWSMMVSMMIEMLPQYKIN